jgi:hypothetical protein
VCEAGSAESSHCGILRQRRTLALALAACAPVPHRPAPAVPVQPLARMAVATPDAEHDLLGQLLAGEMALGRSDLKTAARHYGTAAQLGDDPKVAETRRHAGHRGARRCGRRARAGSLAGAGRGRGGDGAGAGAIGAGSR